MTTKELRRRPLTIEEILRWADAYRDATGKWPTAASGDIVGARFESWSSVDAALRAGTRGLPGGGSLAKLLAEARGVRNIHQLPPLTVPQILRWADDYHARTGSWPSSHSGSIPGSGGEKWQGVENALRLGSRGLARGSSIAMLLAEHRGTRNRKALPPLTEELILTRADFHYQTTGHWPPSVASGIRSTSPIWIKKGFSFGPMRITGERANGPRKTLGRSTRFPVKLGRPSTLLCTKATVAFQVVRHLLAFWTRPEKSEITWPCRSCPAKRFWRGRTPIFRRREYGRTSTAARLSVPRANGGT